MTPEGMAMYTAMSLSARRLEIGVFESIVGSVGAVAMLVAGCFIGAWLAKLVKLIADALER